MMFQKLVQFPPSDKEETNMGDLQAQAIFCH